MNKVLSFLYNQILRSLDGSVGIIIININIKVVKSFYLVDNKIS